MTATAGEIAHLTWDMLDTASWVLQIPGTITKNKAGRSFGFPGDSRRGRHQATDSGSTEGRTMGFRDLWRSAVSAAGLPKGRLFRDLRRSAVRTPIHRVSCRSLGGGWRTGAKPGLSTDRDWCRRWDLNPH